jgi:hypothetical protein
MEEKIGVDPEPISSILLGEIEDKFSVENRQRVEEIKKKYLSPEEPPQKIPVVATEKKAEVKTSNFKTFKKVKLGGKSLKSLLFWSKFLGREITDQTDKILQKIGEKESEKTLEEIVVLSPKDLKIVGEKFDPRLAVKEGKEKGLRVFSRQECLELALKFNCKIGYEYLFAVEPEDYHTAGCYRDAWLRKIFITSPSVYDSFKSEETLIIFRK